MRRIIASALALPALIFVGVMPANAHDGHHAVEDWQAFDTDDEFTAHDAQDTTIIDSHTVELAISEGNENAARGTSIETTNLGLEVDADTQVSFEYEEVEGAGCGDNNLRVFVSGTDVGAAGDNNSWDKNQPIDAQCGMEGTTVVFEIENAGTIDHAGVVFDNAPPKPGVVRVSGLTIGDELISFLPEPTSVEVEEPTLTDEQCDAPGNISIPDVEGASYSINGQDVEPGASIVEPGEHVVSVNADEGYALPGPAEWTLTVADAEGCDDTSTNDDDDESKNDDDESKNDDDESKNDDDEKTSTLPDTGMSNAALIVVAGALLVAGGVLTFMGYRQRHIAKYARQ